MTSQEAESFWKRAAARVVPSWLWAQRSWGMDSPSSAVPIWGAAAPYRASTRRRSSLERGWEVAEAERALISAFSGGTFWSWQATSPPQDRMRSRTRTISQTGGRRLGPWNRLRMRASACWAEPERGVEKGVEGHWYLAIKARPFRRNGAGRTARGGQEKEKKPYPNRRSHRPYPERTAPASNSP